MCSIRPHAVAAGTALALCGVAPSARAQGDEPARVAEPAILTEPAHAAPRPDPWLVPSLHTLGLLTGMRVTEAWLWPTPFAFTQTRHWPARYERAFTMPPLWDGAERPFEWDGDHWSLNVIGHGLLGSEIYLRSRMCGGTAIEALLLGAAGTVAWEYAFEANGVRPSGLDLAYTPAAGLALGELRYALWRGTKGSGDSTVGGILRALIDPFGELERWAGTPC